MVALCCHSNATFGEASEVVQTWVLFTNSPRMPQKGKKTVVQSVVLSLTVQVQIRQAIRTAFVFQRFVTKLIPLLRAFNKSMRWRKLHVHQIDFVADFFTILRGKVLH